MLLNCCNFVQYFEYQGKNDLKNVFVNGLDT